MANPNVEFSFTAEDIVEGGEGAIAEEYSPTRVMMAKAISNFILPAGEIAKDVLGNPMLRQLLLTYLLSTQSMASLATSYLITKLG